MVRFVVRSPPPERMPPEEMEIDELAKPGFVKLIAPVEVLNVMGETPENRP